MTSEVTIRGAGIYGLSVAWEMLSRGARVTIIDPAGVGAGASGGIVGALAPHVPENWTPTKAFQLETLVAAPAFWAEVAETGGTDPGYARTGRLQPLADDAAIERARARAEGAAALWQGAGTWAVEPAPEAWSPFSPTGLVIRDTLTARLDPARATAALAAALRARGVRIVPEGPERGPTIWATGAAGLDDLSRILGREVGRGIKGQAARLAHDARDLPQIFADGLHLVPHADGTLAVGSTTERDFRDPHATDAMLDEVVARARAAMPVLADAPVSQRWAGLRPRARSRQPLLGSFPTRPGQFIANGGFKIGFGTHLSAARAVADLVLDGRDTIPEEMSTLHLSPNTPGSGAAPRR